MFINSLCITKTFIYLKNKSHKGTESDFHYNFRDSKLINVDVQRNIIFCQ